MVDRIEKTELDRYRIQEAASSTDEEGKRRSPEDEEGDGSFFEMQTPPPTLSSKMRVSTPTLLPSPKKRLWTALKHLPLPALTPFRWDVLFFYAAIAVLIGIVILTVYLL